MSVLLTKFWCTGRESNLGHPRGRRFCVRGTAVDRTLQGEVFGDGHQHCAQPRRVHRPFPDVVECLGPPLLRCVPTRPFPRGRTAISAPFCKPYASSFPLMWNYEGKKLRINSTRIQLAFPSAYPSPNEISH